MTSQTNSHTSTGIFAKNIVDRESGKKFLIRYPSSDWIMSNYSSNQLISNQVLALLKCLFYLQSLPESALKEASETLKDIADFHSNRLERSRGKFPSLPLQPNIPVTNIKGKLRSARFVPPIVLEP